MSEHEPKPMGAHWDKWGIVFLGVGAAPALGALMFWAISTADIAAQTAHDVATLHSEITARLDHIDSRVEDLPLLAERVKNLQEALVNTQGSYASLAERLHAMEDNNAANHADAARALGRHP